MDKLPEKNQELESNDSFQEQKTKLLEMCKNDEYTDFREISEKLFADKEVVLGLAKFDGWKTLQLADKKFRSDKEVVLACAEQNINALEYASPELLKDKKFVLKLASLDERVIYHIGEELVKDEDVRHVLDVKEAKEHWYDNGDWGVTAKDHMMIGGTPIPELSKNPGKTLAELWSIKEIAEKLKESVLFFEKTFYVF